MSVPTCMPTRSDAAIWRARAILSRFVAAAFTDGAAPLDDGSSPELRQELLASTAALSLDGSLVDATLAALGDAEARGDARARLLGHAVRGPCPPYELEYRASEVFQQSQTLADLAGVYRAFGLDATGPLAERGDHAAAQWEFLAVLALKTALAQRAEDRDCCIDAQRLFLREHAAAWMPAFFERLRKADDGSLLPRAAALAGALLSDWCAALDVPTGARWIELRPIAEEDSTITCGVGGGVELGPGLAAAMDAEC